MRWVVAALLFIATTINYADRLALSVISTDLRREFDVARINPLARRAIYADRRHRPIDLIGQGAGDR